MTLSPGTRLGAYDILAPLGAGGMGEVYRARDTRLDRDVAIKVLPEGMAHDQERVLRFEREAKLLAALSHPNIAAIYGFEEANGQRFLVLEYVQGETLAAVLKRGRLPVDSTLEVCGHVAAALEAAHEKGIVHRDLKPGNVMIKPDGGVKVLDFGLARAMQDDSGGVAAGANSPTITAEYTKPGVVLGTAAYMSPEQARGRPVDKRTDIWSFGVILYECLSGEPLFRGETATDLLGAILHRDPEWAKIPPGTPPTIQLLLRRCLTKDRNKRLHDIADGRIEIESALGDPATSSLTLAAGLPASASRRTASWKWALCAGAVGVLATLGFGRLLAPAPEAPVLRKFSIPVGQLGTGFPNQSRISADGRRIAYVSSSKLWVRDLRHFEPTEVPGSENATSPFWSPDGEQLGFAKDKSLWTWPLSGGQKTAVCDIAGGDWFNGAVWGNDGKIYFAIYRGGLYEVPAVGGEPRLIASPTESEVDFHLPQLLPDGKHLITVAHRKEGANPVAVISVPGGERKDLKTYDGMWVATYSPSGHLLLTISWGRKQQILGVPFSEAKLEITGEPFAIAAGGQCPTVSRNGTLVYSLGASHAMRELAWVDRDGRIQSSVGQPRRGLDTPSLSADGRSAAVVDYESGNADIWIYDLARGTRSRLVSGSVDEFGPYWVPGTDRVLFEHFHNVQNDIMAVSVDRKDDPRIVVKEGTYASTPDGRTLVFQREERGYSSVWYMDMKAGTAPVRFSQNLSQQETEPVLSPDGKSLAYVSDEAGRGEVFVRRFPDGSNKQQISLHGGIWPFWSRGGDALYFWERGFLMEVRVKAGDSLTLDAPHPLFSADSVGLRATADDKPGIDIAGDGRFLIVRSSSQDPLSGLLVTENWFEEFRGR